MKETQTTSPPAASGLVEKPKWRRWEVPGICALLVIVVFLVFGRTVYHEFVNYDDDLYVYENPIVSKGVSLEGLRWALTYGEIGHWHPLTWATHMLDCQLFGMWAGGHHLTNVLLHATAVVLLFLLLLQMTGATWRCAFVAAAWAIHPLRVESVAWIAERKDVLAAVFFMLTLGAYLRYLRQPSTRRYLLVVVLFALGLMSKNMLVTLPCVLLLLDYWPLKRLNQFSQFARLLKEKIPLFALSAFSCAITFLVPEKVAEASHLPLWLRLQNVLVSCGIYLRQTLWPVELAVHYPNPTHAFPLWEVIGSLALLCVICAAAFVSRKRHPGLLVGWLWFIGMLVPVIGLIQISTYAHADRYTYLPQIGLWIAGTWMAADWAGQWRNRRMALGCVGVVVLCVLLVAAYHQTTYWRDRITLWTHTLECTQDNSVAHNNLGYALQQQGRAREATAQFLEALRINPAYANAHNNLGNTLLQQGQTEEAMAQYRELLRFNPHDAGVRNNLGIALFRQGRTQEAIAQYREALRISPRYAAAYNNLGHAMLAQGQTQEAIAQFRELLQVNPAYPGAHYNLGNALHQQGQTEEAIAEFREALQIDPGNAEAHNNLGNALFQQGRMDEAIAQYREALRINPSYAEAHYNLGNALLQQGRMEEAIAQFREALRINPAYALARYNLGNALFAEGRTEEAIEHLQKALELQPANADIQTNLAAVLATAPQPSLRQGARAVELATQASQSSGGNNPRVLRTLAAAYAAAGKFPNAVQTAQHALQLTQAQSNNKLAEALRREIKLYEAGQPYREGQ